MKKYTAALLLLLAAVLPIHAAIKNENLQTQRSDVIKQYVKLLGAGDFQAIPKLFTQDATVISSTGAKDQPPHFYKTLFTKTISNTHSNFINIFEGKLDPNMMAAYFDYSWRNYQGKMVSAKFLDLFIFQDKTAKFKTMFIFSNTFQEEVMRKKE